MQKVNRHRLHVKGFSLVEVLLAIAIFTLLSSGIVGAILYGEESSALAGNRVRAVLYAEEGLEAVRNMRDTDSGQLATGTYGLEQSGGVWTFSGSSDIQNIFTRSITISDISVDRFSVTSHVSWQQNVQRPGSVTLTTYLTKWQEASGGSIIRAIEYYLGPGDFSGSTYNLTLDYDLEDNYFVIVQGSDGSGSSNDNRGPDENYAALTADPNGTGDLSTSGSDDVITLERGNSVNDWIGVVTVVECLSDCSGSGFTLLDTKRVNHNGNDISGSDTSGTSWGNIDQVMLMGGFNGSGCMTQESNVTNTKVCHARIWPSGSNTIEWTRDSGGASLSSADSTVAVIEWGSAWTVQREHVTGNNGGNGADSAGEYDSSAITSVNRDNTWVWGTGHTNDQGIGDAAEGVLVTLGDGATQNTTETEVSVGMEYNNNGMDFEVYALTHPDITVDYRFKPDGDSGAITYDASVDLATNSEARMALITNGSNGTGNAYPRPIWSARYAEDDTIRVERRRSGQNWSAWIQGVDFSGLTTYSAPADTVPPEAIADLALSGETINSVDLHWTAPGDDGFSGTAASYDVRYSTSPITSGNWASAMQVAGEPVPSVAGSSESMAVSGLSSGTTYYFAIRTSDEMSNESDLSNVPNTDTLSTDADSVSVDLSGMYLWSSSGGWQGRSVRGMQIENTSGTSITIDTMTVSWTGGLATGIQGIFIDSWQYRSYPGSDPNDSTVSVAFTLSALNAYTINHILFDANMSGATLTIIFNMSDGSSKAVTGISL